MFVSLCGFLVVVEEVEEKEERKRKKVHFCPLIIWSEI